MARYSSLIILFYFPSVGLSAFSVGSNDGDDDGRRRNPCNPSNEGMIRRKKKDEKSNERKGSGSRNDAQNTLYHHAGRRSEQRIMDTDTKPMTWTMRKVADLLP